MAGGLKFIPRIHPFGWLLLLLLVLHGVYGTYDVLLLRPQAHHLWRQTDCLSLAWNYYDTTWNLFEPAVHNQFAKDNLSGRSAGEFPLLYWLVGLLWRITGPSEFLYRALLFGLHLLGTLALFDAVRRITGSAFWAGCIAVLVHVSPVLVYFSVAFLTDVPAFDLVLIGWWCVVRYGEEQRIGWWLKAMICFALAMLLKMTAGMSLVALTLVLLDATIRRDPSQGRWSLFAGSLREWTFLFVGMAAVLGWYAYAASYNATHGAKYTFNALWPIWDLDADSRARVWRVGLDIVLPQLMDRSLQVILLFAVLGYLLRIRREHRQVFLFVGALLMGVLLYILFWFQALDNHDYYFINPMILVVVIAVVALHALLRDRPGAAHSPWVRVAAIGLLLYNMAYTNTNMAMRYDGSGQLSAVELWPRPSTKEVDHWNGVGLGPLKELVHIRPALAELGITPTDKVIFLDDGTINASLVLMGNRGWTSFGWGVLDPGVIDRLIDRGARYLLFVEDRWLSDPRLFPYLRSPKGVVGKVRIIDLRAAERAVTCVAILDQGARTTAEPRMRLDTMACSLGSSTWCFNAGEYPFEVVHLVAPEPTALFSELFVQARFEWDVPPNGDAELVFTEDGPNGPVSYQQVELQDGLVAARFVVHAADTMVTNKLYIVHRSAGGFRIRDLHIDVVHHPGLDPKSPG
jgi:hypothetical protein